jgi:hypothetical protein
MCTRVNMSVLRPCNLLFFQNVLEVDGSSVFEGNSASHAGGALWIVGKSVARLSGSKVITACLVSCLQC